MKKYLLLLIALFAFIGCGGTTAKPLYQGTVSNEELFKRMYDEKTTSILVLPAVDNTTSAETSELFSYTIVPFLADKGYYVFSPSLVDSFLKSENITEPKMVRKIPIKKLREVFNPDAILYTNITKWDTNYKVLSSGVAVSLSYELVSAKSGKLLWSNSGHASSISEGRLEGGSVEALVLSAVVSAVSAAVNAGTDYQTLALRANKKAYYWLPLGKYHYDYAKQKSQPFGTFKIFQSNIDSYHKNLQKDPNAKLKAGVVSNMPFEDSKVYGYELADVQTDENHNIVVKNGRPIFSSRYEDKKPSMINSDSEQ